MVEIKCFVIGCSQIFKSNKDLIAHFNHDHALLVSHKCDTCDFYGNKLNVAYHKIQMHQENSNCTYCDKPLNMKWKNITIRHISSHFREECGHCFDLFETLDQAKKHAQDLHGTNIEFYKCPFGCSQDQHSRKASFLHINYHIKKKANDSSNDGEVLLNAKGDNATD